jgi:hypothetical protein
VAEGQATLVEREAQERVSRMEAETVTTLASTYGEAEGFTQSVSLLKGELVEACQDRDMVEVNTWGLFDTAANAD